MFCCQSQPFSPREQVIQAVNQLFLYQDEQRWDDLVDDILGNEVHLDMSTMGLKPIELNALDLAEKWRMAFSRVDAVYHSCTNHVVTMNGGNKASVKCCATTSHYKASAVHGMTRDFVGTYEVKLQKTCWGQWRVTHIKFELFYILGNGNLE